MNSVIKYSYILDIGSSIRRTLSVPNVANMHSTFVHFAI